MTDISLLAKVLGGFFFYSPEHSNNQCIIKHLENKPLEMFDTLIHSLKQTSAEELNADFLLLLEGGGDMPAAPWGSVYLDKEKVVFGSSALEYRAFLLQQGLSLNSGLREPEDHFGLILLTLSLLIEKQTNPLIIKELLSFHLLPWSHHFLSLMQQHSQTEFYKQLAKFTQQWLDGIEKELNLSVVERRIYI